LQVNLAFRPRSLYFAPLQTTRMLFPISWLLLQRRDCATSLPYRTSILSMVVWALASTNRSKIRSLV
jgi:hypothetical protein